MDFKHRFREVDLNGTWSLAIAKEAPQQRLTTSAAMRAAGLPVYPATVPGNFELDLAAAGVLPEPFVGTNITQLREYEHCHLYYFRQFKAEPRPGYTAELDFLGLDCYADIYLNGQLVGSADNMLVEHAFTVDQFLQCNNELLVHIRPAVDEAARYKYPPGIGAFAANYESLHVRKAPHMYGWDIMPRVVSGGMWRPVRLLYLPEERLENVYLETIDISGDHGRANMVLHYETTVVPHPGAVYEIAVQGTCAGRTFAAKQRLAFGVGHLRFGVAQPLLWWPRGMGEPHLYTVQVSLVKDGVVVDSYTTHLGIRQMRLERTSVTGSAGEGEFCFYVNGERVFIRGANWVPADAFHSRDVMRIPHMLVLAADVGCNMLRCWGGNVYEDDLFYSICDEKGIMIWQDFAMACAIYPQDESFATRLSAEVRQVVRRLRQHPCVALWAGDNECDQAFAHGWFGSKRDPNTNRLTRAVIPAVLQEEDPSRSYLPSSPYIDSTAYRQGVRYLLEDHLWGPRDYHKSRYYTTALCHFASEIGYHGCPAPSSIRRFITPEKLWPYQNNEEWTLHSTSPVPELDLYNYRVGLMANQVRELFSQVPDNLADFALASQISQAEAMKFFVEHFRSAKWRRTGIIWWNLIDGWPQFSDAVVDYYFVPKLAFYYIKAAQQQVCLMLREPENWGQSVVAVNDTRCDVSINYQVRDVDTEEVLARGQGVALANTATVVGRVPYSQSRQRFYMIEWETVSGKGYNHYLAGNPPYDLAQYREWLQKAALYPSTV